MSHGHTCTFIVYSHSHGCGPTLVLRALRGDPSSLQGEWVSCKEQTTPREEPVSHKERCVSVGKVHAPILDPTLEIKETECH